MKQFLYLFESNTQNKIWTDTKKDIECSIDVLLEKDKSNEDVLLLMKDLLEEIRICTSINDYTDEVLNVNK